MRSFLLELGTEELPPGVIEPAAQELLRRICAQFEEHGLKTGAAELFYTPRRLTVRIKDVPEEKPGGVVELQGPPKKAGFDPEGKPTKTAIGFARAQGKGVEDLYVKQTPKGEYLFVKKEVPPVPVKAILEGCLGELIRTLPFPKTMRWNETGMRFSRPVRWILCLLGEEVVKFEFNGLVSGNTTLGHRNFSSKPIVVVRPEDYETVLWEHRVMVNPVQRQAAVERGCAELAQAQGGTVVSDPELVKETVNITEFPEPILCRFNPDYLTLPKEVLITALKMHQRCFSVQEQSGRLLPYFIAVANTPGCDQEWVRFWYERAIESRLRDARFFVESDLKVGLEPLVEEEKRVVWIEGLGSYYEKTQRLRELCRFLCQTIGGIDEKQLDRAALLSKADLLTAVVREKEFTSLQGVMGGVYAKILGEPEAVAQAIGEQYLPRSLEDRLPESAMGGVLSIADKIDNIVATFLAGTIPTGSEDPFGVRRQATGVLLIILKNRWPVGIPELVAKGLVLLGRDDKAVQEMVLGLFRERLSAILAEEGIRYDVANAVLATVWHTPIEAQLRARALIEFRNRPEFEKLIIGQKRVANILRGQDVSGLPDPALFQEEAERVLWQEAQAVEPKLKERLEGADYLGALELLLSLRRSIDRLFDDVLVMCEDERLRMNRLRLLSYVRSLFSQVADLSAIVLEG
ncbi:glycine--tRNA ligase subunit beta [candidate division WOR-3 bacterium]|nr:glycine--tRNA ligase subunit beta [candidate division WOR-3 bacterium]